MAGEATEAVRSWLRQLSAALEAGDVTAATALFGEECYWRDLVSLTWNIRTVEGREAIAAMLAETLATAMPRDFQIIGEATTSGPITEGWFSFETAVARGKGHVRVKDGKGFTILTTMDELKGHEEKKGPTREKGIAHGASKHRVTWTDEREAESRELGYSRQPYCVIIGGGQGGIALGARLKRLGVPTLIIEKTRAPVTHGEIAIARSFSMIPSGTTTCPIFRSRSIGRCSPPRTKWAIGSSSIRRSWNSTTGLPRKR